MGNQDRNAVSVIDTHSNTVVGTVPVGQLPLGMAVHPDGSHVYVANFSSNDVSVIDTSRHVVVATIPVCCPFEVAVHPDGIHMYVINRVPTSTASDATYEDAVSVVDTITNTVIGGARIGMAPSGLAVHPDGSRLYVGHCGFPGAVSCNEMWVMDTATGAVIATAPRGEGLGDRCLA